MKAIRFPRGSTALFLARFLVILGTGLWVFRPALSAGWLWDDNQEVTANPVLPDPSGLAKIWSGSVGADYFPLKTTVQWFEWRLWGADPAGYHAVSVALHLLGALLFWRLLRRLGLESAWIGGLLFAVHPLVVESVAWAAELKNTLSLPLLLLAMTAYADYEVKGRSRDYGLSLLWFILAMLAKSSVIMFPAVILLQAWWRRGRVGGRDLRASVPFFAVSLLLGLVTVWFQHHRAQETELVLAGGFLSRLACAGLALTFYLGQCLWPAGLSPIYPRWVVDPPAAWQWLPWLAWAGAAAWLWTKRAGWGRPVLFALGFFALNLLPVLGLVTNTYMRITWVADHFAYISILGLIGLAVAALDRWPGVWARGLVVTAVAIALGAQSRAYAAVFHDEETLWTYTLRQNPAAWSAHYNLANRLAQRHALAEAEEHYRAALRLVPDFTDAHFNLGNDLFLEGRLQAAADQYLETLRLDPGYAYGHVGLGNLLMLDGRAREAVPQYEEAHRLKPADPGIEANLEAARRAAAAGGSP
jgi:protein O-mannosyl-transferase